MFFSSSILTIGLLLTTGCGDPPPEAPKATKAKEKQNDAAVTPPKSKETVASKAPKEAPKGFDPLQGKTLKQICSANGLLLLKWPYEKIQNDFRKASAETARSRRRVAISPAT